MSSKSETCALPRNPKSVPPIPGEEIVISGISGRFPRSSNLQILSDNLYNQVDMVDDEEIRWKHFHPEVPKRMGKISGLEKFDATFFGIHHKQASTMDPQGRILIETAFEAMIDAGVSPKTFRETKTGCFIGTCISEAEKTWLFEKVSPGGFGVTGCSRAMLANRLSYCLGITGPSFQVDTACSSSMYALDCAFTAIKNGECEAAFVGGANLLLHPYVTLQFNRIGALANNGFCRPFDKDATGYTRSEAICVILLQKAKNANRIYATVEYTKTNCDGYKQEGISHPSGLMQEKLLTEFYNEIDVDPSTISYVEAHSTGTVAGDPQECYAIDNVFCKNRKSPLLVGSVKSNLGHSEATSGACSIAKVIIAFERGLVAPNINFNEVRPDINALVEGRLKVCTEPTVLDGNLVAINSFGFGGANAHALLSKYDKQKVNSGKPEDKIPRIINWSGRVEDGVNELFNAIESRHLDAEFVALIQNTQSHDIPGYMYRAYGLYESNPNGNAICLNKEIQYFSGMKRPFVWVFTGTGSQWTSMGSSLMNLPLFRETIQKLHAFMKSYNIDLINIITSDDPIVFKSTVNVFVGIAAIQGALIDVLNYLNLTPDLIIGHSVGEIACAYADGSLTIEQMMQLAYYRGLTAAETKIIKGAMAAIGLGHKEVKNIVPPSIDVACHNGLNSTTVSGPAEDVAAFIETMQNKGIFAKGVDSANMPYHSRYIVEMAPKLLNRLKKAIPNPKQRSKKWLSTSVPMNRWDQEDSKYSSAEYHTNNLLSPVLFEETMSLVPPNAIVVEIAPHGLLQAILKMSLPNAVNIPLVQRGNKNNLNFFLSALGKLYLNGLNIPFEKLYPEIRFPVSVGTPMLSPLVRWDHSEDWFVTKFELQKTTQSLERKIEISLKDEEFEVIGGHVIDRRCLIPASAYLQFVWETLALIHSPIFYHTNVEFEDIRFLRATSLSKDDTVELTVMILRGTGQFSVAEGSTAVATGFIKVVEKQMPLTQLKPLSESQHCVLNHEDFYKELRLRGYKYDGRFKSVQEARSDGLYAKVKWDHQWIPFIDGLLQARILYKDSRCLDLPTRIQKLRINATDHINMAAKLDPENPCFEVKACNTLGILVCGGIEIFGIHTTPVGQRNSPAVPILESYKFISHFPSPILRKYDAVRACAQLAIENHQMIKVKVVEKDINGSVPIIDQFEKALKDFPLIVADLILLTSQNIELGKIRVEDGHLHAESNCYFLILDRGLSDLKLVESSLTSICGDGFLVSREDTSFNASNLKVPPGLQYWATFRSNEEVLVLFQKITKKIQQDPTVIYITTSDYKWIERLQTSIKDSPVILVAQNDINSGIIGLVNCLRKEVTHTSITCVFIDDSKAPPFNLNDSFYSNQLKLGMALNIYRDGEWGTYRHLQLIQTLEKIPCRDHCYVNFLQTGDLSSLTWLQGAYETDNCKSLVNIQYASLNFRDIMFATGRLPVEVIAKSRLEQECVLGFEYAGVDQNGERLMGMVASGSLASHVIPAEYFTWKVPEKWSLREATTCPVAYMTAYTAFFTFNPIQKGNSILIHAGSGGVGLAAIRVALAYGLEVFTTVSNPEKKKFIMDTFPQLKESNIGNSRDCSFEAMIKFQTNGRGVDYVLNSLSDEKLHASIRCLARCGTFLEIGKFDLVNDTKIGLGDFLKEIAFRTVFVDHLFAVQSETLKYVSDLINRDLRSGIIQPLHTTVFEVEDIEKAFRYFGSGKHVGKVILKIRDEPQSPFTVPIKVVPRVYFNPSLAFVIPGGLGGFGLEFADWMVIRGARKLVMSSSRGITSSYQSYRIKTWEGYGCKVLINTSDISTREGCEKLLRDAQALGPVGGIFNLAAVLRDDNIENQDVEKFAECMAPKAVATLFLDELSRKLCPQLKYFVVFSSISCGRGNIGQSNYGMANSVMERIIEHRVASGLPGKAIQWGAVGDVGMVAVATSNKLNVEIAGTLQQRLSFCLIEMDVLLATPDAIVGSFVVGKKQIGSSGKLNVIDSILNILGIRDIKNVSINTSLSDVGMDSLMAVEIKQTLEREFEIFMSAQNLRSLTFAKLQELSDSLGKDKDGMEKVKLELTGEPNIGLNILLRNFGEEKTCQEQYVRLQTRNMSDTFNSCAVIIPGIEGVASELWTSLASPLNLPAFVLQLTNTADMTSALDIANGVANAVKQMFSKKEHFYLVGYSYGTLITLLLARSLEESGMTGSVVLIDGTPLFLKEIAQLLVNSETTEETSQMVLITTVIQSMFPLEKPADIRLKMKESPTWDSKVDKLVQLVKYQTEYSESYLRLTANAIFNRLKSIFSFDTDTLGKIKSPITLVRPTEVAVAYIDEDYELSRYTEGKVTLKFIEGNHATMLENNKLTDIISSCDPFLQSQKNVAGHNS